MSSILFKEDSHVFSRSKRLQFSGESVVIHDVREYASDEGSHFVLLMSVAVFEDGLKNRYTVGMVERFGERSAAMRHELLKTVLGFVFGVDESKEERVV